MYRILFFVIVLPIVIWAIIKLLRSPKYDRFCKDIASGKLDTDTSSKDVMSGISKSETDLGKQAETNIKEAEKLKNKSKGINEFLGKRGVVENAEKKEES